MSSPNYLAYQNLPEEVRAKFEDMVRGMTGDIMTRLTQYIHEVRPLVYQLLKTNEEQGKLLMIASVRPIEILAAEIYNVGFSGMPSEVHKVYNILYPNHSVIAKVG